MVSGRSSAGGGCHFGHGGCQIGRAGGQSSLGESSNGAGSNRERTEADREASDCARIRASYRYLNYGRRPPPAYYRRESARGQAALRASSSRVSASSSAPSSSRRSASSSAPSSSRAAQLQVDPQLPGRAGDYVDDADFDNVLAALSAEPTITPEDFVGDQCVDGMVELVQQATVGQEKEAEAEHRQIAMDQPFVFLDSDED